MVVYQNDPDQVLTRKVLGGLPTATVDAANDRFVFLDATDGALKAVLGSGLPGSGGGVSDGDKGDVTVSSSGATWTIDAHAVTLGKVQTIAAQRILGNLTGSTGDVSEINMAQLVTMLATDGTLLAALTTLFQGLDATLTAIAGLSTTADRIAYFTGTDTAALATLTSFARTLIDDTSAANARTTLGLGQIASDDLTDATTGSLAYFDGTQWKTWTPTGEGFVYWTGTEYSIMLGL